MFTGLLCGQGKEHDMIEANGLSKYYGSFIAIKNVTFSVPKGQVAAFLGPNGAGKSTIMKILTGFLSPSAGSARICGLDVNTRRLEAAEKIGYLPENGPLYPDMTPREMLRFFGQARGMSENLLRDRLDFVHQRCALAEIFERPVHKLSKGNRQRVGMAQALLHDPEVLILDEPTGGLDPNQIRAVRDLVRELGRTKTVLLSTHILQEVEAVANHVIFLHEGGVVFDGTTEQLKAKGADLDAVFAKLTPEEKAA